MLQCGRVLARTGERALAGGGAPTRRATGLYPVSLTLEKGYTPIRLPTASVHCCLGL